MNKALRKMLVLVLAIVLSASAIVGGTYAWFTDTVSSARNTIQSGNLDMVVEYRTKDMENWAEVKADTKLFADSVLWEPGHTEVVALRIRNNGSLAFKYEAAVKVYEETEGVNVYDDPFKLSDHLVVRHSAINGDNFVGDILMDMFLEDRSIASGSNEPDSTEGVVGFGEAITYPDARQYLTAGGVGHVVAIAITMPTSVDNVANHKSSDDPNVSYAPSVTFGIEVVATQVPHEADSFGTDYDTDAKYPAENVVDSGTFGGINWSLTETGMLTVSPAANPVVDANCGKEFASGVWREAVIYNSAGEAVAEAYNRPDATPAEGGYFCDRNAVTSLIIEEGITYIGSFAAQFPNLTGEVVIPSTVTYIGQEAFQNTPITKLTFAEGGTEQLCIAPGAFKKLAIEELVLPADRPKVHVHCWALNDCTNLKSVTFPANITTFSLWTHVDYMGNMDYVWKNDSQILARCWALEEITFGSEAVKTLFFNAPYNTNNINAIGDVEIIVQA